MRGHGMTMGNSAPRVRRALLIGNGLVALAVSAILLGLLAAGAGGVPALGPLLVPGHGAWTWQFLLIPMGTGGLLP
jgi:hypothetical protein